MQFIQQQANNKISVDALCTALKVSRASYYRTRHPVPTPPAKAPSRLALSTSETQHILAILHDERFVDKAPHEIYARLLDEGQYYCSIRTMYRLLDRAGENHERRCQRQHRDAVKPELVATAPNQVWSWDITKLRSFTAWHYFYLYVIMDIFSRCVVGWLVAERESKNLACQLIQESCLKQAIQPQQLTLHADRGPSMKSQPVAQLLAHLGVTKSHNRPYVSNDNPFSEAQFKTLKYCPAFPVQFYSLKEAQQFCRQFFHWYNHEHYHTGIALLTPQSVHQGTGKSVLDQRTQVLRAAYAQHPERFKNKSPKAPSLPKAVWINPPSIKPSEVSHMTA